MTARLTKHQKEVLARLVRASALLMRGTSRSGGWVLGKDSGSPAALEHLYRKGYIEREIAYGPRGGEQLWYRPNAEGREQADRIVIGWVRDQMPLEIDARLIKARREQRPVLVYCGSESYVRGVPGPVERDDDGRVVLRIGQRSLVLSTITRVENGEVPS